MSKLSKKTKTLSAVIAAAVIVIALWAVGYTALKNHDKSVRNKAVYNTVSSYIAADEGFAEKYGKVVSTAQHSENYTAISGKELRVPCIVNTEDGRAYLVWTDWDFSSEDEKFTYISVEEIAEN